ncbi:hypothetical protein INR49_000188 [Caranx melampygus]|nr:hypothetical protein INR49_000188 [Caranx melampygus]
MLREKSAVRDRNSPTEGCRLGHFVAYVLRKQPSCSLCTYGGGSSSVYGGFRSNRRLDQTRNLQVGKDKRLYFTHGVCKEGDNCRYSHDLTNSKPAAMICKFFQKGNCVFGDRCSTPSSPPRFFQCSSGFLGTDWLTLCVVMVLTIVQEAGGATGQVFLLCGCVRRLTVVANVVPAGWCLYKLTEGQIGFERLNVQEQKVTFEAAVSFSLLLEQQES